MTTPQRDGAVVDTCREAHLVHCHGTMIWHTDGTWECTELDCVTPDEGHQHVVVCLEVGLGCH